MTITYEFELTALCPNEPYPRNFYQARIVSERLIWTETIEAFADAHADQALSQESLTDRLLEAFPLSTQVALVGQHGRVRITSTHQAA